MSDDRPNESVHVRIESRAFPCEGLHVRSLAGKEAISRLFRFDLEIVCVSRAGLGEDALTGLDVDIVFERDGVELRRVEGLIADAVDLLAGSAETRSYRIGVVPRMFRMAMVSTQDVFLTSTVPELIEKKLRLVGLGHRTDLRLLRKYPHRELTVQYDETDLAFVSRLAEHLGVSFFFQRRDDKEWIVFTDHAGGFSPIEGSETVHFRQRGEERDVFELEARTQIVPSAYFVRDYNYRTPHLDLTGQFELAAGFPGGVTEFGSHHKTPDDGHELAKVRAEEQLARQLVFAGRSDLPALHAGGRFTLEGHPDLPSTDLLLVEVEHVAHQVVAGFASAAAGAPSGYRNSFQSIPADRTYRPARTTPRPRIAGLVTAIVDAGPTQIDSHAQLDDQGRYTVRFLFDTTPPGERPASRPVRFLQAHTGEDHGIHFPLKPGAEVLIAFVNGDPDRPVIVGAVHNPLKPSTITNKNPTTHRIRAAGGITIDIVEEPVHRQG